MLSQPQFDIGTLVQLVRGGQVWTVIWRGFLRVRLPSGWGRAHVYRLNNGFWDCYHEQELHTAWRWDHE
jgi:hypothetical protein